MVALVIVILAVFGSLGQILQIIAIIIGALIFISGIVSIILYYSKDNKINLDQGREKVEEKSDSSAIEVEATEVEEYK